MSERVVVTVNEGKVRGIKESSRFSGVDYYSFFGVPYGQPPINNLRFKDPVKVKPWNEIYKATSEKYGCAQFSLLSKEFVGDEDCLFNNIHIPKLPNKNEPLRPVIINIHPGSYGHGSPHTDYFGSPIFVMHNDVVYISISFRLHILGFLNLGLKECSGNQALKDIILSLHWIKDNIRSFGGDPENVTLLGSSSGATIIHILMLSPAAKGLFHKAVLMGAYLQTPVVPHEETNEHHAREVAVSLGYEGDVRDHKKLLSFLKKQPIEPMIKKLRPLQKSLQKNIAPILPIGVFNPSFDQSTILPESPKNLLSSMARIPIMVGASEKEAVMGFARNVRPSTDKHFKSSFCQNCFGWGYHLTDQDINEISRNMEKFYTDGEPVEDASLSIKIDIQTDILLSDIYDAVINPISDDLPSSVFVYKFNYEGHICTMNTILKCMFDEPIDGTFHGGDFCYWNHLGDPQDKETHDMIKTFTKLITTFARTGDPNYEDSPIRWKPSTPDHPCYLMISKCLTLIDGKINNERLEFWDDIKKQFRKD